MSLLRALPQRAPEVFSELSLHVLSPCVFDFCEPGSQCRTFRLVDAGARCLLLGQRQFRSIQIRIRDRIGIKKALPDLRTEALNEGVLILDEDSDTEKGWLDFYVAGLLSLVLGPFSPFLVGQSEPWIFTFCKSYLQL